MLRFSIIDHFLVSESLHEEAVNAVYVKHDVDNRSDHDPIFLSLLMNLTLSTTTARTFISKCSWHRASEDNISAYRDSVHTLLSEIPIPVDAILCRNLSCFDVEHKAALTRYARFLSEACLIAADAHIPTTKSSFSARVPGWNEYVAPFREKSLFWHHLWLENGKPRTGILADIILLIY
jgi:hypothetical protein